MARFVIRRIGAFGMILLLISLLIFSLLAGLGVDPAAGIFSGDEEATMRNGPFPPCGVTSATPRNTSSP